MACGNRWTSLLLQRGRAVTGVNVLRDGYLLFDGSLDIPADGIHLLTFIDKPSRSPDGSLGPGAQKDIGRPSDRIIPTSPSAHVTVVPAVPCRVASVQDIRIEGHRSPRHLVRASTCVVLDQRIVPHQDARCEEHLFRWFGRHCYVRPVFWKCKR